MIERVIDLALKADPDLEPGMLFVERQFGILEIHGNDLDEAAAAGAAMLAGTGAHAEGEQLRPQVLYTDVIEDIADQHAVIINRNRAGARWCCPARRCSSARSPRPSSPPSPPTRPRRWRPGSPWSTCR